MKTIRARVTAVHRTLYTLCVFDTSVANPEFTEPEFAAIFRPAKSTASNEHAALSRPTVGDWVTVEVHDDGSRLITSIESRSTTIIRRAAGENNAPQLLAANVDTAFVFSPLPDLPNVRRLARLVSLALAGSVAPVIVLSRRDTVDFELLHEATRAIHAHLPDVEVITTSAVEPNGLQTMQPWIWPGATVVFLGPSGAGKSTMLNALAYETLMQTGATRHDGAGRHTTTHRALFRLSSGVFVIDTPGLREVGVWASADVSDQLFADIAALAEECRFADCTHRTEPGCAVRAAVHDGRVTSERWDQWQEIRRESEFLERSEAERRNIGRRGSIAMRDVTKRKWRG